ncbi:MAG: DEAD/DEAH box helicase, partial [Chloroflexota bacterium]
AAIVDEAAQMTLPATLGALRLARRFILIGDHKQLPPVVISEPRFDRQPDPAGLPGPAPESLPGAARCALPGGSPGELPAPDELAAPAGPPIPGGGPGSDWSQARLSTSLFELLYRHLKTHCPQAVVDLNEQYRMNAAICAIPRRLWYDDDLRPAGSEIAQARMGLLKPPPPGHRLGAALDPDQPVVFLDIPWGPGWCGARTNQREAQTVAELIEAFIDLGLNLDDAGVIAPFRAQVALVRRALAERLPAEQHPRIRSLVDTVDRFQGQERSLVVLSLATHGAFIHDLLQDERRLNVAITRARHKLVILGDAGVLSISPRYAGLIEQCVVVA